MRNVGSLLNLQIMASQVSIHETMNSRTLMIAEAIGHYQAAQSFLNIGKKPLYDMRSQKFLKVFC
jgi:hypothetical protein